MTCICGMNLNDTQLAIMDILYLLSSQGGIYLLQLMDMYGGGWTLIIIGFFEVIAVAYIYGEFISYFMASVAWVRDSHTSTGSNTESNF